MILEYQFLYFYNIYMPLPVINLFHVFFVGPLLAYVGYNRTATPEIIFSLLSVLGVVVILYHGHKSYKTMTS